MSDPHAHCSHQSCQPLQAVDYPERQTLLLLVLCLVLSFAAVEWIVGLMSHSLALVADSGHMASDGLAIALASLAVWLSQRQKVGKSRWEMWAALLNGLALGAIAGWILWEAASRLQTPAQEIASVPMLITAAVGAVVNGMNASLLHRSSHQNLNLKAAFLHVLGDAVSSVGVILAAIAIALFHWVWIDGAVSLLVAGFILYSAVSLVKQILTELTASS
ncbi:MAG: cation transporter [Oscillatoriales cyanobacterium C42_A2020_001]|nr:cation transporter [Leptolyngbyaceae cyanobacterium C42_A2020_001]